MTFGRFSSKISTRILMSFGAAFALAAVITVVAVRNELRRQAIVEAESKALIIMDHKMAVHNFVVAELRPKLLKWTEDFRPSSYFEPAWMSSTYAVRQVDDTFKALSPTKYYARHCAVDARDPDNEAGEYERGFLERLNLHPNLVTDSKVADLDGEPFFYILRRGLVMEAECLQCHGTPDRAPAGMVEMYGSERGFRREVGKTVSVISVRVPLKETYAEADSFSIRLSALFLTVLTGLFLVQHLLIKRLFLNPLRRIHGKALELAASDEHLGETIAPPPMLELAELTESFNRMSENLKIRVLEREGAEEALHLAQSMLEARVEARTGELSEAYEQLKAEIYEKSKVQEALIQQRDFVESLVNTAQTIILVLDNRGHIVRFNTYLEKLAGYTLEEVRGQDWFHIFLPLDHRSRVKQVFFRAFSGHQIKGYTAPVLTKSGEERQIEWYSARLKSEDSTTVGLLSIGQDITERKRAEEALRKSEMWLRSLYSQLLKAQEEERRRIAKEVHDSIGSPLAAIKMGLENAIMVSEKGKVGLESLRALAELAQHSMRECRRIMTDLRPPVLDDYGIVATIKWLCDRFQIINPQIRIERRIDISEEDIPEPLRIVLFRIVQEALNNAARHSGAKIISVLLLKGKEIQLCVHDDGCGFDMDSVLSRKAHEGGFGISNMKERTELSGGSFQLETDPEKGTTIYARWTP